MLYFSDIIMLCFIFLLLISCCALGTNINDPYTTSFKGNIEKGLTKFGPKNNVTSHFSKQLDIKQGLSNIDIETPELKFFMKNCELSGIKNCTANNTKYNLEESYFDQYYWCPNLSIRSDYEVSGLIGNVTVKGHGQSLISYYNYDIVLRCHVKKNIIFLNLQYAVSDFSLKLKPDGVMMNLTGINFSENDKDTNYDENLKTLEETIREPLMRSLVTPYVKGLQLYPVFTGIFNNKTFAHSILKDIIIA